MTVDDATQNVSPDTANAGLLKTREADLAETTRVINKLGVALRVHKAALDPKPRIKLLKSRLKREQKMLKRAIKKGFDTQQKLQDAADLTDNELTDLMALSKFSASHIQQELVKTERLYKDANHEHTLAQMKLKFQQKRM